MLTINSATGAELGDTDVLRRRLLRIALLVGVTASAEIIGTRPGLAAEAASGEQIICYPGPGPTGGMARLCESEMVVTVEPVSAGTGPLPSPATAKLHEDARLARSTSWPWPVPDSSQGRERWTGISLVANGVGGAWQTDRFTPQGVVGMRVDGVPLATMPIFVRR